MKKPEMYFIQQKKDGTNTYITFTREQLLERLWAIWRLLDDPHDDKLLHILLNAPIKEPDDSRLGDGQRSNTWGT